MYLRRLELQGFKTFAPYTEFQFDEGITAIVGPNGSGKSNIADAVRWVLGEQSYVALRGKRTVDMIFAGTSRRARLGMAEAVMTFDNSSQWLPLDFSEVTVARRAYRSGENRYFINGSRVRLRDVLEMLGGASLGRSGFVVIGQGLVDAALSLRADERRTLFEEAAGIHIYKDKRTDALRRLEETQQNMLRVNDILNEIQPRMRDLERQSKRTEEYELLSHDLEQLLRLWYGYKWHSAQAALNEAEALLQRRQDELDLGRARMHEVEALITHSQQRQAELRRTLSAWHTESGELHARAEVTGRELAVSRERLSLLRQHRQELDDELARLQEQQAQENDGVQTARAAQEALLQQLDTRASEVAQARNRWESAVAEREAFEQRAEDARAHTYELATALSDVRNRRLRLEEERAVLLAERERQAVELKELESRSTRNEEQLALERTRLEQTLHQKEIAAEREIELQQQVLDLQNKVHQQQAVVSTVSGRLQRLTDRRELLAGMRQSLGGFVPAVRILMQSQAHLPGIVGPVVSVMRVPQRLEAAIDAALGHYAQALVVESLHDAQQAIAYLRDKAAGWAAFLPLDTVKAPQAQNPPAIKGVLGMADQLVEFEARYSEVVRLLLGNTVVVESWETARRLLGTLPHVQTVVTLAGDSLSGAGVTGGGSASTASLLAQEREWRELPDMVSAAQSEESTAHETLDLLEQQLQAAQAELKAAQTETQRWAAEHQGVQQSLAELQQLAQSLKQEAQWHRRVEGRYAAELQALAEKETSLQQEEHRVTAGHSAQREALNALLSQAEGVGQQEGTARQALSESETALAVTQRQTKTQEQVLAALTSSLIRLEGDISAKAKRVEQLQSQITQLRADVASQTADSEALSAALVELAAQIQPAEAELMATESQILQLEEELSLARRRLSELQALFNQQVLERERRQDDLRSLEQRIEDDLGDIEYPSERVQQLRLEFVGQSAQLATPVAALPENTGADIRNLKTRIRRLGSINPNAPVEYRQVQERFQFLHSQIADLEQSATSLQQVIRELDRLMEDEFLSLFEVAAKEFSRYFNVLFGGGQARLKLTDPDDPAFSGVEIFAQPPGRRPQPLAVLSGGERALTATALLFAVLKAKPLPFCLLDEVDAMLDESNVGRFRSVLEEFAEQTQFIVITHNRVTIEAASTIYGVSMGEEGVSQVVSLKLPEGQEISTPA